MWNVIDIFSSEWLICISDISDIRQHKDIGVSVALLHRSDPVIQILHCHYPIRLLSPWPASQHKHTADRASPCWGVGLLHPCEWVTDATQMTYKWRKSQPCASRQLIHNSCTQSSHLPGLQQIPRLLTPTCFVRHRQPPVMCNKLYQDYS